MLWIFLGGFVFTGVLGILLVMARANGDDYLELSQERRRLLIRMEREQVTD